MNEPLSPLAQCIQARIQELNRTPAWISKRSGLSADAVRNIYRNGTARDKTLENLAPILGLDVAELKEARDGPLPKAPPRQEPAPRPAGKRRPVVEVLRELYALHVNDDAQDFIVHVRQPDYYRRIKAALNTSGRMRRFSITPVSSDYGYSIARPKLNPKRRGAARLQVDDEYGAFVIEAGQHKIVLIRLRVGTGREVVSEQALASRPALLALETALEIGQTRLRQSPGRKGLWHADMSAIGLCFKPWKAVNSASSRFECHPLYQTIADDLASFLENLALHTRYNQPGLRKVLMTGPPGTGKTSILKALAHRCQDSMCVVYAPGNLVFETIERVAASPRPSLVIAEEIDALYQPSSEVLTFLDGMDTPRNPQGTFLAATTNYPHLIDKRILKRPGRIDRTIRIGPINKKSQVVPIARQYLPDDVEISDKDLGDALARTTPAEMIEIINQSIHLAGSDASQTITKDLISQARKKLTEELARADNLDEEEDSPEGRSNAYRMRGAEPDLDDAIPF